MAAGTPSATWGWGMQELPPASCSLPAWASQALPPSKVAAGGSGSSQRCSWFPAPGRARPVSWASLQWVPLSAPLEVSDAQCHVGGLT